MMKARVRARAMEETRAGMGRGGAAALARRNEMFDVGSRVLDAMQGCDSGVRFRGGYEVFDYIFEFALMECSV